jgi:hypothetical protein
LPVGLTRLADGRCIRDPDAGIQASIVAVFEAFAAAGTVPGALRQLLASGIRFPQLAWGGENAGTIIWCDYNPVRVRTFSLIRPMPGPMFMGDDATVLFLTVIAAIPVAAQQLSASFRSSLARTHQLRLQLSSRS